MAERNAGEVLAYVLELYAQGVELGLISRAELNEVCNKILFAQYQHSQQSEDVQVHEGKGKRGKKRYEH